MPQLDLYRACDEIFFAMFGVVSFYILTVFIVMPLIIKRHSIMKLQKKKQYYERLNIAVYYSLNKLAVEKQKYIVKI